MLVYFKLFYREIGPKRLAMLVFLAFAATMAQGIGITMVLPILQGGANLGQDVISRFTVALFGFLNLEPVLLNWIIILVLFFILHSLLLFIQENYSAKILAGHLVEMRSGTVQDLFDAKYGYFLKQSTGFLSNAISTEIDRVNFSLQQLVSLMVFCVSSAVFIALPLLFDPKVTIVLCVVSIPIVLVMRVLNHWTMDVSLERSQHSARLQSFFIQSIRHFKYLKATSTAKPLMLKLKQEIERLGQIYYRMIFLSAASQYSFQPLAVILLSGVVFYYVSFQGRPIADILFLLFIFKNAITQGLSIQPTYRKFLSTAGSLAVYHKLRDGLRNNRERVGGETPVTGQDIIFRDVSFGYGQDLPDILSNINLRIPCRRTVALVGPSGAGKSTIVNLLTGILRPVCGEVYLGPTSYADIDFQKLRSRIGYITQEPTIFNDSIANNITLFADNGDARRLNYVLEESGLLAVPGRLGQGSSGKVGDDGNQLSGGQRQRLAIAREIYRDTEWLIMDEAMASLDSISESQMEEFLLQEKGRRTFVVISHRLSTIRHADWIYVFDMGRIVAEGKFDELKANCSIFRQMAEFQAITTG
ncbi:MAG: ABC transporter ATP-binding protein [Elusimicrobia bacterium]|nr:ABC transporter ATP-binding protein [Elusimicrobiota bacterium]